MRRIDLTGMIFGELEVVRYLGYKKYECKCSCGRVVNVSTYNLKNGSTTSCGHIRVKDLKGQVFGDWAAVEYVGNSKWKCKCSCGEVNEVRTSDLLSGKSKSCGHAENKFKDLTGEKFGELDVLEYVGNRYWKCRCSCGKVYNVHGYALTSGHTKSCGHNTNAFIDITGLTFGNWKVLEYVGNQRFKCQCSCDKKTVRVIRSDQLRNGETTSCGCETVKRREETSINRYGIPHYNESTANLTAEQLDMVNSREKLLRAIQSNFDHLPSTYELSKLLGVNTHNTLKWVHKYQLEDYIHMGFTEVSSYEAEILALFPGALTSCRNILDRHELDLFYPDAGLAIEFNGDYWHSSLFKDKMYHQNKTFDCIKNNIDIIHIFEYEWRDSRVRDILINIISMRLYPEKNRVIYGRKCKLIQLDVDKAREFLDKYHISGYVNSEIKIGITYIDEIVGVATFGKSRFDNSGKYELLRLAYKFDVAVVGGLNRIMKYINRMFGIEYVISYCDISKFMGRSYVKAGFELVDITEPNYVWKNLHSSDIKSRYQTQKHRLLENGFGSDNMTEDEIMNSLDYCKIYNCGNIKFEWRANNV